MVLFYSQKIRSFPSPFAPNFSGNTRLHHHHLLSGSTDCRSTPSSPHSTCVHIRNSWQLSQGRKPVASRMFQATHTVTVTRQPQFGNHHLTRVDIACSMWTRRPSHWSYSTVETLSRTVLESHRLSHRTSLLFRGCRFNHLHHRVQRINSFMTENGPKQTKLVLLILQTWITFDLSCSHLTPSIELFPNVIPVRI